jgi:hypothetical protein
MRADILKFAEVYKKSTQDPRRTEGTVSWDEIHPHLRRAIRDQYRQYGRPSGFEGLDTSPEQSYTPVHPHELGLEEAEEPVTHREHRPPMPPYVEPQSVNTWTARESPTMRSLHQLQTEIAHKPAILPVESKPHVEVKPSPVSEPPSFKPNIKLLHHTLQSGLRSAKQLKGELRSIEQQNKITHLIKNIELAIEYITPGK